MLYKYKITCCFVIKTNGISRVKTFFFGFTRVNAYCLTKVRMYVL